MIRRDNRGDDPREDHDNGRTGRFWWAANQSEVSQFLHAYQSHWLPARLLTDSPERVADALFEATRHWRVGLHFNKALSGASPEAVTRDRATAVHARSFDAAALVTAASSEQYVFPDIPGHEPDVERAAQCALRVTAAMAAVRSLAPSAGSYVNETDYFQANWRDAFWGDNYNRLLQVKQAYDPHGLFRVHHGVGGQD